MIPANTLWVAIAVIVVMYVTARWVRSHTTTDEEQEQLPHFRIPSTRTSAAEELDPKGDLTVSRAYFAQTDIETGPADASDFYDELFIDLRDSVSGQVFENSIHVTTLRGLDRVMREEHWDSVIGTELLIVRKFDRDTILQAAVGHLQEIYEVQIQLTGHKPSTEPIG
jgi:hypothetical protein